ncbi:MAG: sigma-70 family RNA polymerase sigma factor [Saprospiraceae bacterium]|nr:sigma-70 family RNA polymerase sigma factor [Saprospiraceae bacterium]
MARPDNDQTLFARLQAGDQTALRALFDSYFDRLAAVARRIVLDDALARDVAQQVYIQLWERRTAISLTTDLYPYLRKMTINAALAEVRTTARRSQLLARRPAQEQVMRDVESDYLNGELQEHLLGEIERLPNRPRTIFRMSRFEHLTYDEIAHSLGISVKTVEDHMSRALRELHAAVRRYLHLFF